MNIKFILVLLFSFLVTPLYAGSYLVFYSYDGTVNLGRDTAIAIRYEYDGPSPLKEALTKFFDGLRRVSNSTYIFEAEDYLPNSNIGIRFFNWPQDY
ncbi:MAG: hypothetical protein ACJ0DF_13590 [Paracoccaceae bacterium]